MEQAIDFEDVLTSLIVGQRRTGHSALPCFHHVHSLKPPFTLSPMCLQLGDLRAHKLQGAPVRPGANWNHQLAEVQLFGEHRLSVPSQTGLWILQPWPIKQGGQHRCVIKMCHLLLLRSFPRTPGTEATPLPHQEQREGKLHVRPGRSGGNEVGTSGGDPRGGAHERHLVLSRWLHQEQGKAGPGRFYTSPPVHKLGGNHFKLHWLHRFIAAAGLEHEPPSYGQHRTGSQGGSVDGEPAAHPDVDGPDERSHHQPHLPRHGAGCQRYCSTSCVFS